MYVRKRLNEYGDTSMILMHRSCKGSDSIRLYDTNLCLFIVDKQGQHFGECALIFYCGYYTAHTEHSAAGGFLIHLLSILNYEFSAVLPGGVGTCGACNWDRPRGSVVERMEDCCLWASWLSTADGSGWSFISTDEHRNKHMQYINITIILPCSVPFVWLSWCIFYFPWDKLTVLGSNRAIVNSLSLGFNRGRAGRNRVLYWWWPCIFGNSTVAGGSQRLIGSLTKPRPIELIWCPHVRGRRMLRCIQGPKTRTQNWGLKRITEAKQNKKWIHWHHISSACTSQSVCVYIWGCLYQCSMRVGGTSRGGMGIAVGCGVCVAVCCSASIVVGIGKHQALA